MRVNLKGFEIALLVVLAVCAAGASSAQATGSFTAEKYPAVFTGHLVEKENTNIVGFTCKKSTYEATLTGAATSVTVTPHWGECTDPFAFTLDMNGCHYVFEALTKKTPEATRGRLRIVCPPGQTITFTAATCSLHISPQTVGGTSDAVTFTNTGATSVTLDLNISTLHFQETSGFLCSIFGNKTRTDGALKGQFSFHGYPDEGPQENPSTAGKTQYKHGSEELDIHVDGAQENPETPGQLLYEHSSQEVGIYVE